MITLSSSLLPAQPPESSPRRYRQDHGHSGSLQFVIIVIFAGLGFSFHHQSRSNRPFFLPLPMPSKNRKMHSSTVKPKISQVERTKLSVAHKCLSSPGQNISMITKSSFRHSFKGRVRLDLDSNILNCEKHGIAQAHGNLAAADEDLVEVNAGGKVIVDKRSILTQIQGTRSEALFSRHCNKMLQWDRNGRIFLNVNPTCFPATIVNFLIKKYWFCPTTMMTTHRFFGNTSNCLA